MTTKKLIINADDFGYTPGVTYGIIEAFQKGVVTSTTALTVADFFPNAMKIANAICPELPIGVHMTLTLNKAKPVLDERQVPSLINESGTFWGQSTFADHVKAEEVYVEWEAQILKFIESGKYPTHLDSHHNVHGKNETILDVAVELARKYNLPLRNPVRTPEAKSLLDSCRNIRMTDEILPQFYDGKVEAETLYHMFQSITESEKDFFEINVHPAFLDPYLLEVSSYAMKRLDEFQILISDDVKQRLVDLNILTTNYRGLQ